VSSRGGQYHRQIQYIATIVGPFLLVISVVDIKHTNKTQQIEVKKHSKAPGRGQREGQ